MVVVAGFDGVKSCKGVTTVTERGTADNGHPAEGADTACDTARGVLDASSVETRV